MAAGQAVEVPGGFPRIIRQRVILATGRANRTRRPGGALRSMNSARTVDRDGNERFKCQTCRDWGHVPISSRLRSVKAMKAGKFWRMDERSTEGRTPVWYEESALCNCEAGLLRQRSDKSFTFNEQEHCRPEGTREEAIARLEEFCNRLIPVHPEFADYA